MRPVRVLLIAPSLEIVGGQSVQAARLLAELRKLPQLRVDFLPVNPRAPGPMRRLQKIKYVRTLVTSALYLIRLVANIARYDILHIFTPGYFAFMLAPAPAILLAQLLGKKTILNYRDGRAEDHLTSRRFLDRGMVSPPFVSHLLKEHDSGRRDNSHWLWMLLMLELWFRNLEQVRTSDSYSDSMLVRA